MIMNRRPFRFFACRGAERREKEGETEEVAKEAKETPEGAAPKSTESATRAPVQNRLIPPPATRGFSPDDRNGENAHSVAGSNGNVNVGKPPLPTPFPVETYQDHESLDPGAPISSVFPLHFNEFGEINRSNRSDSPSISPSESGANSWWLRSTPRIHPYGQTK